MQPAAHWRLVPHSTVQVEPDHLRNPSLTPTFPQSRPSQQRGRKPRKFVEVGAKQSWLTLHVQKELHEGSSVSTGSETKRTYQ